MKRTLLVLGAAVLFLNTLSDSNPPTGRRRRNYHQLWQDFVQAVTSAKASTTVLTKTEQE